MVFTPIHSSILQIKRSIWHVTYKRYMACTFHGACSISNYDLWRVEMLYLNVLCNVLIFWVLQRHDLWNDFNIQCNFYQTISISTLLSYPSITFEYNSHQFQNKFQCSFSFWNNFFWFLLFIQIHSSIIAFFDLLLWI